MHNQRKTRILIMRGHKPADHEFTEKRHKAPRPSRFLNQNPGSGYIKAV